MGRWLHKEDTLLTLVALVMTIEWTRDVQSQALHSSGNRADPAGDAPSPSLVGP